MKVIELEFTLRERSDYPLERFPVRANKIHVPAAFVLSDLLKQDFAKSPPVEVCLLEREFVSLAVSERAFLDRLAKCRITRCTCKCVTDKINTRDQPRSHVVIGFIKVPMLIERTEDPISVNYTGKLTTQLVIFLRQGHKNVRKAPLLYFI